MPLQVADSSKIQFHGVLERARSVASLTSAAVRRQRDQWRAPEAIVGLQRKRLARLLRSAELAPYYQHLLQDRLDPGSGDPFEILRALPILDRAKLMALPPESLSTRPLDSMFKMTTSGSSGTPMRFYRSSLDEAELSATWFRVYRAYGVSPFISELNIGRNTPSAKRGPIRLLREAGILPQSANISSLAPIEEMAALAARLNPGVIGGYAAAVQALAEHAHETQFLRRAPKLAMCGAMEVSSLCLDLVARGFRSPVANVYVTNDAGVLAWSCPADRDVLHTNDDVAIFEFVDAHGKAVPEGQQGELVITPLHIHGMPLLRYRIGDLAARVAGRCRCGRGLGRMTRVLGRSSHTVRSPTGKILMSTHVGLAFGRIGAEAWVARYQAREMEVGRLMISIVTRRPPTEAELRALLASFTEVLEGEFQVELEIVDDLPLAPNGKFQYLVPRSSQAA
jgi:phenylacetate-CoA ligase